MKAERLFRVLGMADPALVEEALEARRGTWRRWAAAAACLALIAGLGVPWLAGGGFKGYGMSGGAAPGDSGGASGNAAAGGEGGVSFMSYGGSVLPLTTVEDSTGLTAEREVIWDFAPGAYPDGERRQWGAEVTDSYTLHNTTEEVIAVTALYPFTGSFDSLTEIRPHAAADGGAVETTLYAGAYSGGFQSTFGAEIPDTMNLDGLSSWEGYQALLGSGAYLEQALGDYPVLDIPAVVYEFSDFAAPHETYPAATQAVSIHIDEEETTIFTYGFNGMECGEGFRRYSYFVPDGMRNEPDLKLLVVLGEDIGAYGLQGYEDGGCGRGEEIEGVSCAVVRSETTLDAVLDRLCRYHRERYTQNRAGRENAFDMVPYRLYRGAVAELMAQYGALSGAPVDRYADGRLDDILSETMTHDRVLYLSFPVMVPAGGSVQVECGLWKTPSYDFACAGSGNEGLQGYDLMTRLGSSLRFTRQSAALMNTENVEITGQDYGFDLDGGVTAVELDLEREHYFLEMRVKESLSSE